MPASNQPFFAAYSLTIFKKSLIFIGFPWSSKLLPTWRNRSSWSRVKSCGLPRRPGIGLSSRRKMVVFDTLYFIAAENADNPRILRSSNANFGLGFMVQQEKWRKKAFTNANSLKAILTRKCATCNQQAEASWWRHWMAVLLGLVSKFFAQRS